MRGRARELLRLTQPAPAQGPSTNAMLLSLGQTLAQSPLIGGGETPPAHPPVTWADPARQPGMLLNMPDTGNAADDYVRWQAGQVQTRQAAANPLPPVPPQPDPAPPLQTPAYGPANPYTQPGMVWGAPLQGDLNITSGYGSRPAPVPGATTNHLALDLAAETGTPIMAAGEGIVARVFHDPTSSTGYGLIIAHPNGYSTRYIHMNELPALEVGARVALGQQVGAVGATGMRNGRPAVTGSHLDFQLIGPDGNPVDPRTVMSFFGTPAESYTPQQREQMDALVAREVPPEVPAASVAPPPQSLPSPELLEQYGQRPAETAWPQQAQQAEAWVQRALEEFQNWRGSRLDPSAMRGQTLLDGAQATTNTMAGARAPTMPQQALDARSVLQVYEQMIGRGVDPQNALVAAIELVLAQSELGPADMIVLAQELQRMGLPPEEIRRLSPL